MRSTLLMGNEAFAWAALEAGVNVVAGYPGTPSSELVETVAKLHAAGVAHDVYVEWSDNEKAALELLVGASASGARGLFTCKQMGLNVAADALLSANRGRARRARALSWPTTRAPFPARPSRTRAAFAKFAKVPVLDPWNPESGADMMRHAFEVSETWHTPVIVRPTTRVNHTSTFFEVPSETHARPVPEGGFRKRTLRHHLAGRTRPTARSTTACTKSRARKPPAPSIPFTPRRARNARPPTRERLRSASFAAA